MTDSLKDQGNKAFAAKDYDRAIALFSEAIKVDSNNHVLWSNRSAAFAGKRQWDSALEDAEACIKVNPSWAKGFARKGAALHGAHRYDEAIIAYEAGLELEDSPAIRKGLKEVQDASAAEKEAQANDPTGFSKMFSDPQLIAKLAANPRTSKYLSDRSFVQRLEMLQKNPNLAGSSINDPRMIDVLGVLLGIDMQGFSRPEGSDDFTPSEQSPPPQPFTSTPKPTPSASTPINIPTPKTTTTATEDVTMADLEEDEADLEEKKAKEEALKQKQIGNDAYKKRQFDVAAEAFERAWELWPKDLSFLTNLSAVYFEQGKYDKCIETCEKAVEEGRSMRADFKLIAKALGRAGSAYYQKSDYPFAIKNFQKSLTEHRTADILNKLREAEKKQASFERDSYIDPVLSEKAREEGNALFKSGDFVGAVKSYTESIKRDPKDPRGYNNRALCYTKLAALPEALKDAEEAVKVDNKFVKGYIRKSTVLFSMREYTKALEACEEAAEQDDEHKHTAEIQQQILKCNQALMQQRAGESDEETLQRAMRDPEIAGIMNDPVMQQILQQSQQDPGALADHMKNPLIRAKIQKLVNSGIIKTR